MAARVKWWEAVEEPTTVWRACVTDDGLDYYVNTETNETTWDKPEELMTEAELSSSGDWVWVPDPIEVFVPARVLKDKKGQTQVEMKSGETAVFKSSDCTPMNRSSLARVVSDLTLLDDMSPQLILHCLKKRFSEEKIYTNVGNILISINPYKRLPLYTEDMIHKYMKRTPESEFPPHVFTIAHDAYYGITAFQELQSIIISGESGAGKTEATKQCLQYLAAIAGSKNGVEGKILMANPILEGFGNAKTLRNDNSSRFGKYMEVYFSDDDKVSGCQIRHYLLEKVRVSQPADNERNFHVFYQLCKAAPPNVREKLSLLSRPAGYSLLATCVDVPTVDDIAEFAELERAFKDLGFSESEVDGLYSTVAAVLSLGNLQFAEEKADQASVSKDSKKWLDAAASNLNLDKVALGERLVTREIKITGQETTHAHLSPSQASDTRLALCKFVYGRMFDWLVARINRSFAGGKASDDIFGKEVGDATDSSELYYIGILDIFGFEILQSNSFEQLCINFTNEMLQQHFNNNTFKMEEKLYQNEGIDFVHIEFIDNEPMIELITQPRRGVLPMLDEELRIPGGSDTNYHGKLLEEQKNNPVFEPCRKLRDSFAIRHYAGLVTYTVPGFLEKNGDTLTEDLIELLRTSESPFLQQLYPPSESISAKERKHSLSYQFQTQLKQLMAHLYRTQPHYIRCIKPNDEKKPLCMIPRNCNDQLTYSGVFEAVAIRKQGYPFRLPHEDFVARYKKICESDIDESTSPRDAAMQIVKAVKLDESNVRVGNTRMLYRAREYRKLELDWSIVTKNQRILDELERLVAIDATNMERDEKDEYIVQLAAAVRESDLFRIKTAVAEKGRKMLEKFVEERVPVEVKERMSVAKAEMNRDELEDVLELCDAEGYIIKLTRECRELLEKIIDADEALTVAMAQMSENFLERALDMCREFNYCGPLVGQAVKMLKGIRKARAALDTAMVPPFALSKLRKALELCGRAGYIQAGTRYAECVELKAKVEKVETELEAAKVSWDQARLERVLALCDERIYAGHQFRGPLEEACRDALTKVIFMNEVFKSAAKFCIESEVVDAVAKGRELGIRSKAFDKLRKLAEGPYDDFLKEQKKRAKKCGHHARAVKVMVKRADRLIDSKGGTMAVSKFSGLKDPDAWAAEKGTGKALRMFKGSGMLRYQSEPLHAPLTLVAAGGESPGVIAAVHAKIFSRKFQELFTTVQQCMGNIESDQDTPRKLHQLLHDAVKHVVMRDEAYLAIIKQCNGNPDMATFPANKPLPRGFALLALFLTVFPCTRGFEGHLECWLRTNCLKAAEVKEQYKCKYLLRRLIYEAPEDPFIPPLPMFEAAFSAEITEENPFLHSILESRLRLGDFEPAVNELSLPPWANGNINTGAIWREVVDAATGKPYYFNPETNETSWSLPEGTTAATTA